MNLREKTLFIIGITFIIAFVVILAISITFYTNTFLDIERQGAEKDNIQSLNAFDNELRGIEGSVGDWGWWDDTYSFVQDRNPDYITNNYMPSTFENLRLNYILITNSNGTVIYAEGFDFHGGTEIPVPEYLVSAISTGSPLLVSQEEPEKVSGILAGPDGAILVASTPVLKSDLGGPSPGFLVMARKIDSAELTVLSQISGEALYLNMSGSSGSGSTVRFAPYPLKVLSTTVNQTRSDLLSVESTISDGKGNPAFSVGMTTPRDSYINALFLIRNYFILITILMAVFAGLVILIIDKLVLARLSILIDRVQERSRLPKGDRLRPMTGNDEFNKLDDVIAESQQRIQETEAKFRRIVETSQEGICIMDRELRLTYANERLARLSGYSVDELLGRTITALMAPEEHANQQEKNERRQEGVSETYERRFTRKDGSVFFGSISATPIFTGPVYSGSFAMITDITDRKRAETALQLATRKLNVLSMKTLTDLVNQLFTLQGYIELSDNLAEGKLKDYIAKQRDSAGRIQNQLAYIRNFQEMGIQIPRWQNVNNVFLYAISHLDLSHIRRTLRLGTLEIYADPLLEKVLLALAENSLIHGKKVTEITCSYTLNEDEVMLIFEDNGVGVPADQKEKIFDHHYTDQGFPLSLAREILSITDITIRETGEYGRGVRFEIRIRKGFFRAGPEKMRSDDTGKQL